jgi:hypothetical protein
MSETERKNVEALKALVGDWEMEVTFQGMDPAGGASVSYEWMPGERFLVQRWEVPVPEAPDGLAVIGWDEGRGTLLQHYFDSRGVARVYEMTLEGGTWTLERTKEDFSPLEFSQRFTGRFNEDGSRIDGTWEISHDHETWEKDFDLSYLRRG